METQLIGVTAGGKHGNGDEAAVTGGKLGPVPDVFEEHVVSELGELGD